MASIGKEAEVRKVQGSLYRFFGVRRGTLPKDLWGKVIEILLWLTTILTVPRPPSRHAPHSHMSKR